MPAPSDTQLSPARGAEALGEDTGTGGGRGEQVGEVSPSSLPTGKGRELPAGPSACLWAEEAASAYLLAPGGQEGRWPSPQRPRVLPPAPSLSDRAGFIVLQGRRGEETQRSSPRGQRGRLDVPCVGRGAGPAEATHGVPRGAPARQWPRAGPRPAREAAVTPHTKEPVRFLSAASP